MLACLGFCRVQKFEYLKVHRAGGLPFHYCWKAFLGVYRDTSCSKGSSNRFEAGETQSVAKAVRRFSGALTFNLSMAYIQRLKRK